MEGSAWSMRDLRSEMYASGISEDDETGLSSLKTGIEVGYVTREEYNRKIRELESKIRILESKINGIDGWSQR